LVILTILWKSFKETVAIVIHFLDNVIDANKYPVKEIEEMSRKTRRIGLGIMGWADLLVNLNIPYDSEEALELAKKIMKELTETGRAESERLGSERGNFPDFKDSIWFKRGFKYMRNSTVSCVAPTGSISILAGCSSGIEPLFSIVTVRHLEETLGTELVDINSYFENVAIKEGFYSEDLIEKVSQSSSIKSLKEIPENVRRVFVTAHDISPEWHVRMQAAFQEYTDNAVSKTVNLPNLATPHDVEHIYLQAWKFGCKGITVYRSGSMEKQVITCRECEVDS
jgi:ribonucleoside-diphosphate reductase alpha chain